MYICYDYKYKLPRFGQLATIKKNIIFTFIENEMTHIVNVTTPLNSNKFPKCLRMVSTCTCTCTRILLSYTPSNCAYLDTCWTLRRNGKAVTTRHSCLGAFLIPIVCLFAWHHQCCWLWPYSHIFKRNVIAFLLAYLGGCLLIYKGGKFLKKLWCCIGESITR